MTGESVNNTVLFQITSESEFVGPPLGTYMQGTMSMIFDVLVSGELIYVGAGKMPRRSANKSGSIYVVRILVIEANKPAHCSLSLPTLFLQDMLSSTEKRQQKRAKK